MTSVHSIKYQCFPLFAQFFRGGESMEKLLMIINCRHCDCLVEKHIFIIIIRIYILFEGSICTKTDIRWVNPAAHSWSLEARTVWESCETSHPESGSAPRVSTNWVKSWLRVSFQRPCDHDLAYIVSSQVWQSFKISYQRSELCHLDV